ncbi:hypothetical protein [Psychrobacillus sp. FSL K6-1267]|uniref:hypothetical protein n=1 Tax=Psychrobacillus sp. FSL K6-1267 TaxID=2921543 RepID=UPI0030FD1699
MIKESLKSKLIKFISEGQAKELLFVTLNQIDAEEEPDDYGFFGHSLSNFQLNKLDKHFEKSKKTKSVGQYLLTLTTDRGIYSFNDETFGDALINKAYWSKLVNDKVSNHDKDKLIRISIFLKLNLLETTKLLQKAGFTLSEENSKDNLIIFCLEEGIYDLKEVEEILAEWNQRTLFSNVRTINSIN